MSYAKAMKFNKRRNKAIQPCLSMPFDGLPEGKHIESYTSKANRTATGYNVRVKEDNGGDFQQVSEEFKTEDEAIDYINNNSCLEQQYKYVRIYSTEGMHISGW